MSLADAIFILGLALVIFGPTFLSNIDRQTLRPSPPSLILGYCNQLAIQIRRKANWRQDRLMSKLVVVFRRASEEFKRQTEDEKRAAESTILHKPIFKSDGKPSDGN